MPIEIFEPSLIDILLPWIEIFGVRASDLGRRTGGPRKDRSWTVHS